MRADGGAAFLDPAELARIDDLELLARTVVAGLGAGVHASLHTGMSAEFAQYRAYAQGDDTRSVDWKLYGRTDRLHVKECRDETHLCCTVLLDCSASRDGEAGHSPANGARHGESSGAIVAGNHHSDKVLAAA